MPTHLGFHVVEAGRRATCRSGTFLAKCEMSRGELWEKLPALSILVVKAVGDRTKIPQNAQEQRKKPQVQCTTLLIYLCREVWRPFVLFGGNFREQRSLIRETDRDQPPWLIWKRTQRVGCLWSHRDAPSSSRRISGKLTEENRGATGTCLNFLESICTNRHRIFGFLRVLAFILRWSKMIDRDFCMSTK